jgi:hypothetical protein
VQSPSRYGITMPLPAPLRDHPGIARELADAGYTDVWSIEVDGLDGFTPLTWPPRAHPR